MKDHEIAELVNKVTIAVKKIFPGEPQQLRAFIARDVNESVSKGNNK